MATAAPKSLLERLRSERLGGPAYAAVALAVWFAGALYCSGYEALSTGFDNWPGSLIWSAAAVLPWLVLFEWSKSPRGRQLVRTWGGFALALVWTAALSMGLEYLANAIAGSGQTPVLLALMRRLPAIGASFLLIVWARGAPFEDSETDQSLADLASSIDWVAAADNYVELHIGTRTVTRRMTLTEAERALSGRGFFRIHRRYLVNRRRVVGVVGNGSKTVRLDGGIELPVGRRFAANLKFAPSPQSG